MLANQINEARGFLTYEKAYRHAIKNIPEGIDWFIAAQADQRFAVVAKVVGTKDQIMCMPLAMNGIFII